VGHKKVLFDIIAISVLAFIVTVSYNNLKLDVLLTLNKLVFSSGEKFQQPINLTTLPIFS